MEINNNKDAQYIKLALDQAQQALILGEIPVGAVIVKNDIVIATGFNQSIKNCDPSAHAEIIALRTAAIILCNYRLSDCEIYITLEPCAMCAGAILQARLARVIYGVPDLKSGASGSVINLFQYTQLNQHTKLISGIMVEECRFLLKSFFIKKRNELKVLNKKRIHHKNLVTPKV